MRTPAIFFFFSSFLFPTACAKPVYVPPPEPDIFVTVSGSAPKFFVAESCYSVIPQGKKFSVTIIVPGSSIGTPIELNQEDMNRVTDEVAPTLVRQGVDLHKPFIICVTKPRPL